MDGASERLAEWVATWSSLAECAKACGMSSQALGHYLPSEGRKAAPKKAGTSVLARFAKAGLDVTWYITGKRPSVETPTDPFLEQLERVDWSPLQRDILRRNAERAAEIARELEELAGI